MSPETATPKGGCRTGHLPSASLVLRKWDECQERDRGWTRTELVETGLIERCGRW